MKDIDFEELDRAVSSLLSDNSDQPAIKDDSEPAEKVLDLGGSDVSSTVNIASAKPLGALPTIPIVNANPTVATTPTPAVPSLAGRRSTGQFMDLVHTSSNTRRPAVSTVVPTPSSPSPIEPKPVDQVATPTAIATVPETQSVTPVTNPDPAPVEEKPLESPFIPGTVVDKRPLGAFSGDQTEQPTELTNEVTNQSVIETDSPKSDVKEEEPKDEAEKLPDELQDELLKIESDESVGKLVDDKPTEEPATNPVLETSDAPKPQSTGSIAQQYEEHPSTGEQTSGAIYNTDNYHKSLVVPKKKSGWLWVLLIVLLIILGAAAGAGFFIYIAPNL